MTFLALAGIDPLETTRRACSRRHLAKSKLPPPRHCCALNPPRSGAGSRSAKAVTDEHGNERFFRQHGIEIHPGSILFSAQKPLSPKELRDVLARPSSMPKARSRKRVQESQRRRSDQRPWKSWQKITKRPRGAIGWFAWRARGSS